MLDKLRQNANKWFIKFLLTLVMASFVMWGIVDMIVKYQSNQSVAHIGKQTILVEEFARSIERLMQMLQQRGAKNVETSTIADRALNELIHSKLIEIEIEQLGLAISDSWLREVLHNMPVFQRQGRFDPDLFRHLLAQNRLSDVRFLSDLREQLKTQNYTAAVVSGVELPKVYSQYVIKAVHVPYVFSIVTLSAKNVSEPPQPAAEELQLYYTNNTTHYVLPESRTVNILHVDTRKLIENVTVDDADVQALYSERASTWQKPERRDVQRLTFATRAAAEKVVAQLEDGRTLKQLSKEWKQSSYQEDSFESSQAPDAIANILFTMKEGGNTGIIETPGGYSIYQVTRVHTASTQQLDQTLREQLTQEIRMARSGDTLKQWLDQLNDTLASGQNISDVAKKFGLQVSKMNILATGRTPEGAWCMPHLKPTDCERIAKEAFALSSGQASPLIEVGEQTSFVVSVQDILPARTPEFNEVSDKVKKDWVMKAKEKLMEEKCRQLTKASNAGDFAKTAGSLGLKVVQQKPISSVQLQELLNQDPKAKKKQDIPAFITDLDSHTVASLFSLQPGESVVGKTTDGGFAVVMLDKCLRAPSLTNQKNFDAGLHASFERDLSALLLVALRKKHPVSIDAEVVKKIAERMDQRQ